MKLEPAPVTHLIHVTAVRNQQADCHMTALRQSTTLPQELTPHRLGKWEWATWEFRLEKRVPLAIVLGWVVLASLAFGICGLLRVQPQTYLLVLAWGIVVGLAQWRYPAAPRLASAVAGLVVFLGWDIICGAFHATPGDLPAISDADFVWLLPFGAVAGYATGTLITGILLCRAAAHSLARPRLTEQSAALAGEAHSAARRVDAPAEGLSPTAVSELAMMRRESGSEV